MFVVCACVRRLGNDLLSSPSCTNFISYYRCRVKQKGKGEVYRLCICFCQFVLVVTVLFLFFQIQDPNRRSGGAGQ